MEEKGNHSFFNILMSISDVKCVIVILLTSPFRNCMGSGFVAE